MAGITTAMLYPRFANCSVKTFAFAHEWACKYGATTTVFTKHKPLYYLRKRKLPCCIIYIDIDTF